MNTGSVFLRLIGMLLVLSFILLLPPALVLRNTGEAVFSRDQLRKLVDKAVLDPALPVRAVYQGAFSGVIAEEVGRNQRIDHTGIRMSSSDADEVIRIVEGMMPKDLLDSTVDEILNALFDWLDGPQAYPELVIDTRPFTRRMRSSLPALVERVVDSLPTCTDLQLREIVQKRLAKRPGRMKPCAPPEPYRQVMKSAIIENFSARLAEVPPAVNVAQRMKQEVARENVLGAKKSLRGARSLMHSGWVAVFGLYLLSIPLAARSKADAIKWAGWPLALAGTITVMIALGIRVFGDALPQVMIRTMGTNVLDAGSLVGMVSVVTSLASEVGRNLLKQGGWMVIVGGGALIVSRILAKRGVEEVPGD
jgi:hypothetical protein